MSKVRLDTLLADRGLFGSRARAAASVMAGEVRLGDHGERAVKPGQLVADDVARARRRAPALRLARRASSSQNALDALGVDVDRPPLPRRRRVDRRLHRLPAPARGRARDRARRRLRRARVVAARRSSASRCSSASTRAPLTAGRAARTRPDLVVVDVSFISLTQGAARRAARAARRASTCWRWSSRSSRSGASASARAASCATARLRARRGGRRSREFAARELRRRRARLRAVRACRGRRATSRPSCSSPRPGRDGRARAIRRGGRAGGRGVSGGRAITVFSHARPAETDAAMRELVALARERGHHGAARPRGDAQAPGGRATAGRRGRRRGRDRRRHRDRARRRRDDPARAARATPHTSVPVFGVNFGEIGFLATVERERRSREALRARARRRVRDADAAGDRGRARAAARCWAINDVAIHRRAGERVAELAYAIGGRGGRPRALRRPRRRHARRLDGLQPRQRRAGAGVGRGGLRRLVHRAALADRARARRRARRPADRPQPLGERRRRVDRRAPGRRARAPARPSTVGFLREAADLALLPGRDVLPAPARDVRPPGVVQLSARATPARRGRPGAILRPACAWPLRSTRRRVGRLTAAPSRSSLRRRRCCVLAAGRGRLHDRRHALAGRARRRSRYWNGTGYDAELRTAVRAWNTSGARVRFAQGAAARARDVRMTLPSRSTTCSGFGASGRASLGYRPARYVRVSRGSQAARRSRRHRPRARARARPRRTRTTPARLMNTLPWLVCANEQAELRSSRPTTCAARSTATADGCARAAASSARRAPAAPHDRRSMPGSYRVQMTLRRCRRALRVDRLRAWPSASARARTPTPAERARRGRHARARSVHGRRHAVPGPARRRGQAALRAALDAAARRAASAARRRRPRDHLPARSRRPAARTDARADTAGRRDHRPGRRRAQRDPLGYEVAFLAGRRRVPRARPTSRRPARGLHGRPAEGGVRHRPPRRARYCIGVWSRDRFDVGSATDVATVPSTDRGLVRSVTARRDSPPRRAARSVGPRWYTARGAPRAARREPAADRARRAAPRAGPERAHRRDGRGQDRARARARPAARRQAAHRDRAARRRGGLRRGRLRPAGRAARAARRARCPDDAEELVLARRVSAEGRTRAYLNGRCGDASPTCARRPRRCSRSTASTSTAGSMLASAQLDLLDAFAGPSSSRARAACAAAHAACARGRARSSSRLADARRRARARARPARVRARARSTTPRRTRPRSASCSRARERLRHLEALRGAAFGAAQAIDARGGRRRERRCSPPAARRSTASQGVDARARRAGRALARARATRPTTSAAELRALRARASTPSRASSTPSRSGSPSLERLKRKHGGTIEAVLEHAERCRARHDELERRRGRARARRRRLSSEREAERAERARRRCAPRARRRRRELARAVMRERSPSSRWRARASRSR